jgi:tartrate dehydrogenase/decarboxylase/D-malate dehydrogenase
MRRHRIAVIPGDGIGREVTPVALEVLEAAGRAYGFALELTEYPWGCDHFVETERMMPVDALDTLRASDAIFLGAVGRPDVPDHVSLWGLLIPIRRGFRQYVNLRPIRLWPGISSPPRDVTPEQLDMVIVRENN